MPANTRCTLHLPALSLAQVLEDGRALPGGTRQLDANGHGIVLDIGSGDYAFRIANAAYG